MIRLECKTTKYLSKKDILNIFLLKKKIGNFQLILYLIGSKIILKKMISTIFFFTKKTYWV